jgi:CBS domain containing-hemolysin-like protein
MAVPESMAVISMMEAFRTRNARTAFDVDDYAFLEGIVTRRSA